LFSGIGAYEEALKNLGVDFEVVNYCEVDDTPARAYSVMHNIDKKLISSILFIIYFYLKPL
jgi:site-specific DNA-cytosine methylase